MEDKGCISTTSASEYFLQEFLDSPLLKLLPEGFDVCYDTIIQSDMVFVHFYLYDNTIPLEKVTHENTISSIHILFNKPYKWSSSWTPLYHNVIHIPELVVNSDFNGLDLTGTGLGTFMILLVVAYSKSLNLHIALLYDASSRFRTEKNIYTKIGLRYIDDTGHEMMGKVDELYDKISNFIDEKGSKLTGKLNQYMEHKNASKGRLKKKKKRKTKKKRKKRKKRTKKTMKIKFL